MTDFVHLHLHTEYSLLDGACKIKQGHDSPLFERAAELGQKAVAITDHGVMYGAIDFYHAARAHNIKPIIGCEIYMAPRTRFDKIHEFDSGARHLVLLCKNMTGYKNLIKIVSQAFIEGFYIKPRADYDLLAAHSEGLIALSACLAGEIPRKILNESYQAAKDEAIKLRNIFGEGNFYLELQDHGIPAQAEVNSKLITMSKETGIPLVATNDAHYLRREDAKMHDVLLCIQTGKTLNDENRMRFDSDNFYMKSGDEMLDIFNYVPEAIENTVKIADMCNLEFEFGHYQLPAFDIPDNLTSEQYLRKLTEEGFAERFKDGPPSPEYVDRIEYELSVINKMGFPDYFLIVRDFIHYAKTHGIPVGPGRGSGAASLVAYCLGITDIEPIKYSLVFERFLNPERVSMPDFDIDFCYIRRPEVIDYVTRKYGADKVAQIVTFGTMAAKGAIRDVARVMGMPYSDAEAISKLIPFELGMTLDKALSASAQLKTMYDGNENIRKLFDTAKAIEGMPRHASTHAAGVVITRNPTSNYVPLAKNDESIVAQYSMTTLESLGLLKMDFLGLRTLTVLADAERFVRKSHPEFKLADIPHNDKATFNMLSEGDTAGVFQVESEGLTNTLINLKPESIEDITAAIALYRPGPMQYIPKYIQSRHNPDKITYSHPLLKPILSVTYGCIIYQEQVLEIFRKLAGYSLGKADMVRRAMAKKKTEQLEKERINFIHGNPEENIEGTVAHGISEDVAGKIFDEIMEFANYAFNKAHSVAYAFISYQTAYLKCHHPKEYMAALLTSVLDSSDKVTKYIGVCGEMGITVLPPDINRSEATFSVEQDAIRFGLVAIKNIGRNFINKVIEEREHNGSFASMQNFCERLVGQCDMNRRALESLVKSGAFDSLGAKRSQLLAVIQDILDACSEANKTAASGQLNLFSMEDIAGNQDIPLPDIAEYSKKELLSMEKETTGLFLSGHPMDEYISVVKNLDVMNLSQLSVNEDEPDSTPPLEDGKIVFVAGILTAVKLKTTRSGSMMAYLTIEDLTGSAEMLAFAKTLSKSGDIVKADEAVYCKAKISIREDEAPKLVCEEIYSLANPPNPDDLKAEAKIAAKSTPRKQTTAVYVKLESAEDRNIPLLKAIIRMFPGTVPVYFVYISADGKKFSMHAGNVCNPEFVGTEFEEAAGKNNVVLR